MVLICRHNHHNIFGCIAIVGINGTGYNPCIGAGTGLSRTGFGSDNPAIRTDVVKAVMFRCTFHGSYHTLCGFRGSNLLQDFRLICIFIILVDSSICRCDGLDHMGLEHFAIIEDCLAGHCHIQRSNLCFALAEGNGTDDLIPVVLKIQIGGQRGKVKLNILTQQEFLQAVMQVVRTHLQCLGNEVHIGGIADCVIQINVAKGTAVIVGDGLAIFKGIGTLVIDGLAVHTVVDDGTGCNDFKVRTGSKGGFIGIGQEQTGFLAVIRPVFLQLRGDKGGGGSQGKNFTVLGIQNHCCTLRDIGNGIICCLLQVGIQCQHDVMTAFVVIGAFTGNQLRVEFTFQTGCAVNRGVITGYSGKGTFIIGMINTVAVYLFGRIQQYTVTVINGTADIGTLSGFLGSCFTAFRIPECRPHESDGDCDCAQKKRALDTLHAPFEAWNHSWNSPSFRSTGFRQRSRESLPV